MSLSTLFDEPPTCAQSGCRTRLKKGEFRFCATCAARRKRKNAKSRAKPSATRVCAGCDKPAMEGSLFCSGKCRLQTDRRTGNVLAMQGGMRIAGEQRKARIREVYGPPEPPSK